MTVDYLDRVKTADGIEGTVIAQRGENSVVLTDDSRRLTRATKTLALMMKHTAKPIRDPFAGFGKAN